LRYVKVILNGKMNPFYWDTARFCRDVIICMTKLELVQGRHVWSTWRHMSTQNINFNSQSATMEITDRLRQLFGSFFYQITVTWAWKSITYVLH